jgi:hypothetical protein
VRAALVVAGWLALAVTVPASPALGCSPPFQPPTIAQLGPDQVVVMGRIGAKVPLGRLFLVERWFNGVMPHTPIVIAFKEGEPVGDCGYPVHEGDRLIIAPLMLPEGLYADLTTLQADPDSAQGQGYLAEATSLFGDGVVPPSAPPLATPAADQVTTVAPSVIGLTFSVVLLFGVLIVLARRRPVR